MEKKRIYNWSVQQAYSIDNYKMKDNEWFSLSQKINGNRATFFNGQLISRQGFVFTGLEHIEKELNEIFTENDFIDGEIVRDNVDGLSDNENFTIGTGVLNSDNADKSCLKFIVFDIMLNNKNALYSERLKNLINLKDSFKDRNFKYCEVVPFLYKGTDVSVIPKFLDTMVKDGKEGLMLNRDTFYCNRRNKGILKIKRFYTMDLRVCDVLEGNGRLIGTLGALVVDFDYNRVNIGTGFTDEQRAAFWKDRDKLKWKIIEVKYKEISKNKVTGLCSLQFPVFVRFRFDKDEISLE